MTETAFGDFGSSATGALVPIDFAGGAAVGDCDGDGLPDVYFTGANHGALYRNRGDGTFEDVTVQANLAVAGFEARGAAFADIDNDGDLDLCTSGLSKARHFLLVNDGHCHFTEEAIERGVAVGLTPIGRSVSFGDYDRDGYLDFYIAEFQSDFLNPGSSVPVGHLFRNRGAVAPGYFEDVTVNAGVAVDAVEGSQSGTFPFTARFTDFDGDGWPDLTIVSDFHETRLFWNDGTGHFTDGTVAAGVGTDEHGMGAASGDFDGDGRPDLFVTSIFIDGISNATGNRLYHNDGHRSFSDVTDAAGVRDGMWGWGTDAFDYDNDGDLDLIMTNGLRHSEGNVLYVARDLGDVEITPFETDPLRVWRNDGRGVFAEVSQSIGLVDDGVGQGIVTFDYDGDGDLDVLTIHTGSPPILFRNDGGNANHWLDIELQGRRSQRTGIGAVVTLTPAGGGAALVREVTASSTYLAQNGTGRAHFGLAAGAAVVDSMRIEWPSGTIQTLHDVDVDTLLRVQEPADCTPGPGCEMLPTSTPTTTPTATVTVAPTGTATPTPPPTHTPSDTPSPTPEATATLTLAPTPSCHGDCDGDGEVTVAELITTVTIALEQAPPSRCRASDTNGSGTITIDELIDAVRSALVGCGSAAAGGALPR